MRFVGFVPVAGTPYTVCIRTLAAPKFTEAPHARLLSALFCSLRRARGCERLALEGPLLHRVRGLARGAAGVL